MVGSQPPDGAGGYSDNDPQFGGLPGDPGNESSPWYLQRWGLALWAVLVAILIGLIVFGLIELTSGRGSAPATTTSPTTPRSTTTTSTPTTPSSKTTTTTTTLAPETTSAPPVDTTSPTHRHRWEDRPPPDIHRPGVVP